MLIEQLSRDLLMQVRGAVHAFDGLDRHAGIAPGALPCVWFLRFGLARLALLAPFLEAVDREDDDKESDSDQQKVDGRHEETTHVFGHSSVFLGLINGLVRPARLSGTDHNEPILQVGSYKIQGMARATGKKGALDVRN